MKSLVTPYIVGITGGSASGKTLFIKELRLLFSEKEICILSQDNYYKPIDQHDRDQNGQINFDLPGCIDTAALCVDVDQLMNGEMVQRPEYLFQHDVQYGGVLQTNPAPILIIEGLFIFHEPELMKRFNLKLMIESDEGLQFERRLKRDMEERNIDADFVRYQWEHHVKPAHDLYLKPYRNQADLIIMNHAHFGNGLKMIANHFKMILKGQ